MRNGLGERMKLTNKFRFPDAIYRAVGNDSYTKAGADYSVTELQKPPRAVALEKTHSDELEEDVSDRIFSLFGQAMHVVAERANKIGIAERRLFITVDGKVISGGMDLYDEAGALTDYKTTSVFKVKGKIYPHPSDPSLFKIKDGELLDFVGQLNGYAEILRQHGHEVKRLEILAILRDWSKPRSLRERDYPQTQAMRLEVPVWESSRALGFIKMRIAMHEAAKVSLPQCTLEDRWAREDEWAVKKAGAKRALRLFSNEAEAVKLAEEKKYLVEFRPGENIRCEAYCLASKFCDQFKALKGNKQ